MSYTGWKQECQRLGWLNVKEWNFLWWQDKNLQHCAVTILEWECSGATFGQQNWHWGGWPQHWAQVPLADPHRTGAGGSVYRGSARGTSSQTPCGTTYGGRTLCNKLFITFFKNVFKCKWVFNLCQGVQLKFPNIISLGNLVSYGVSSRKAHSWNFFIAFRAWKDM